jgi:hypothetical protein
MDISKITEYFTPRTHVENQVLDTQFKNKLHMMSFLALSAGSFAALPVLGVGVLGAGVLGAALYGSDKFYKNYKLAIENMNIYHALKKEDSIHSENYKDLTKVAESLNDKNSTLKNIFERIKQLRQIEESQKSNTPRLK